MVEDKRNLKNNFGRDENENEKENTGRTGVDYEFSFQKGGGVPKITPHPCIAPVFRISPEGYFGKTF